MPQKSPAWKQFEEAVAAFIKTLDPGAEVTHNAKLPDRHTGRRRQRDVWINATVCQQYPILILVSCKRYQRLLNELDIDHFHGELMSSKANKGVLYSYSGFNEAAIEKAKEIGISCCRLYQNQPADLPESLILRAQYHAHPRISLRCSEAIKEWAVSTWSDLFTVPTRRPNGEVTTVLMAIAEAYVDGQKQEEPQVLPRDRTSIVSVSYPKGQKPQLDITIIVKWIFYVAKLEANLLNGSYSVTEDAFVGSQSSAVVDLQGPKPGKGWELLNERPQRTPGGTIVWIRGRGDLAQTATFLQTNFGPEPIKNAAPPPS